MKKATLLLFLLIINFSGSSQNETEIYLFDLEVVATNDFLKNQKNISNNDGYDSQPYFLAKDALLFAGSRNGQTEIIQYIRGKQKVFNNTTSGGEYSPQPIPEDRAVSAVRLDTDGLQRLYRYTPRDATSTVLVEDAKVAYYTWATKDIIVSADIVGEELHLSIHNTATGKSEDLQLTVGRSFHRIPNSDLISFIDKSEKLWMITSINPITKEIKPIAPLDGGGEDISWLDKNTILLARGASIYKYDLTTKQWSRFKTFADENLQDLSRIAVSPEGDQLAVVSSLSPAVAVDHHIQPYLDRDIDAFAAAFTEDVVVSNFFSEPDINNTNELKESYSKWFSKNDSINVSVLKRIVFEDTVIDEEEVYDINGSYRQATIYKVKNGKIASMTFIKSNGAPDDAINVVNSQLKTYNNGDIKGYMKLYSDDIAIYSFPNTKRFDSRDAIKTGYENWFAMKPRTIASIKDRITIGNVVIDLEELNKDGEIYYGIAINEVNDGRITRTTFF